MLVPAEEGAPQQREFNGASRGEPALHPSPGAEHLLGQPGDEVAPGFEEPTQAPCPLPHTLPIQAIFPADFRIPHWAWSKATPTCSPDPLLGFSSALTLTLRQLMLS